MADSILKLNIIEGFCAIGVIFQKGQYFRIFGIAVAEEYGARMSANGLNMCCAISLFFGARKLVFFYYIFFIILR